MQLTRRRRGRVELDADVEQRTLHRMPAHATVAVPGEIGEAGFGAGHLDDDVVAVESVRRVTELGPAQGPDALQAGVVAESGNQRGLLVEVVDAVADLFALNGGPPRVSVVGSRVGDRLLHLGAHGIDLVGAEHALEMDEAGPAQEVDNDVVGVVECERRRQVEGLAGAVDDRRRVVVVVNRLTVEGSSQGGLPTRELTEATDRDLDALVVEQGEAGLQLPDEVAPVRVGELDDRLGVSVAGCDVHAIGGGRVRVGPSVGETEGDGPAPGQMGGGQLAVPRRQPLRKLVQMELVEVDGAEARAHCKER